ncbi:MAG TPA: ROK family protein [Verrucomicrobiae bacterium]|jgi:glucokinase|nr:ROK family protein [Verrucomicrobiae bacterium]
MPRTFLGIEIGGTKLQLCLGREDGGITERYRSVVAAADGAAGIRRHIEMALRQIKTPFAALGVGYGGPIDWKTGRVCCSHHIEGWNDFPLGEWLEKLAGAPVFLDNDANVAALGEARHGAAVGFNPSFYVTLGSGVGGGLIVDGAIYHGAKPGECEIGHIRLDKSGTIVESQCSGWSLDAKVRALMVAEPEGFLARNASATLGGETKLLAPGLAANDAASARILFNMADDLALALSHVSQLLHPEIVVLGGGVSLIGEPLRLAVESALAKYIMRAHAPGPKIALAKLGEDAVPVGALALAALRHDDAQGVRHNG